MGELDPAGEGLHSRLVEQDAVPQREVGEHPAVEVADVVDDEALLVGGVAGPQPPDTLVLALLAEDAQLVVPRTDLTICRSVSSYSSLYGTLKNQNYKRA